VVQGQRLRLLWLTVSMAVAELKRLQPCSPTSFKNTIFSPQDRPKDTEHRDAITMYKYTALTERHSIRILELQPAWKRDADLIIKLLEVSTDQPPNFEALSYAWESQGLNQSISCDGEILLISTTCKAALLRLRRKTRSRLLWIDQICINQTSVEEKNHQVAIMGEIYSKARRALVWLGVNPGSDELLRYATELRFIKFWSVLPFMYRREDWYRTMKAERSLTNSISWFHRIWTLQEVALARRVKILSSEREMDYDQYTDEWMNLKWNWLYQTDSNPMTDLIDARAGIRQVMKRGDVEKRKASWWLPPMWEPANFLCTMTASASSHPSDKIFGIHGVMKKLGVSLPEPDYNMETGEVYWKACSSLMTQTSSLQPLMLVNGLHWNSNFPSWVPDFNQTHRRTVATGRPFGYYRHENAKFKLVDNQEVIVTKAKVIDVVHGRIYQQTELQSNRFTNRSPDLAELVREHIHVIHCIQSWLLASEAPVEHFKIEDGKDFKSIITLVFDLSVVRSQPELFEVERERLTRLYSFGEERGRLIRLLWISAYDPGAIYSMLCKYIEDSLTKEKLFTTPDFANLLHLPEVQLLAVLEFEGLMEKFEAIKAAVRGKAFFWTKEGHFGTAPQAVAVGDVVALIPGLKAPMILRPNQPKIYQVIGPANITGMMNGEQWNRREKRVGIPAGLYSYQSVDRVLEQEDEDNNLCNIFLV
jgi:hypothetical protein